MLTNGANKWKAGIFVFVMTVACIGAGGCGNDSLKDPLQDPKAVTTSDGEVIRYGDAQKSVEEILGTEVTGGNEYFSGYADGTEVFYREMDDEYCMVYIYIRDSSYTTYQGIQVGDHWEDVREKLNPELIRETKFGADILFDDGKQIDANIDQDKWEEDWIRIGYGCYDGDIISIYVLDVKAAGFR